MYSKKSKVPEVITLASSSDEEAEVIPLTVTTNTNASIKTKVKHNIKTLKSKDNCVTLCEWKTKPAIAQNGKLEITRTCGKSEVAKIDFPETKLPTKLPKTEVEIIPIVDSGTLKDNIKAEVSAEKETNLSPKICISNVLSRNGVIITPARTIAEEPVAKSIEKGDISVCGDILPRVSYQDLPLKKTEDIPVVKFQICDESDVIAVSDTKTACLSAAGNIEDSLSGNGVITTKAINSSTDVSTDCKKDDAVECEKLSASVFQGEKDHSISCDTNSVPDSYLASLQLKRKSEIDSERPSKKPCLEIGSVFTVSADGIVQTIDAKPSSSNCAQESLDSAAKFRNFFDFLRQMSQTMEEQVFASLQSRYNAADPDYLNFKAFDDLIESTTKSIQQDSKNIYVYIWEMSNELKLRKKKAGDKDREKEREKYIRQLEKLLERLDKKIKALQNRELSLDDMNADDSFYVREDKLKTRFMKVYKLLCKERKCSANTEREIFKKFRYSGTRYEDINTHIEMMVNRKKVFPDYKDIHNVVKFVNEEMGMGLTSTAVTSLATDIFSDVGTELKRRRQLDDQYMLHGYADEIIIDPADSNSELKDVLEKNAAYGDQRMQDIYDKYAEKQSALKEVPVEVPDDCPSSAAEDGDEEEEEEEHADEENDDVVVTNLSSDEDEVTQVSIRNQELNVLETSGASDIC